jgi:hypothetical protein
MAAGAPVIKFGQFIGQATVAIPAGDHVHTYNCVFANPEKTMPSVPIWPQRSGRSRAPTC